MIDRMNEAIVKAIFENMPAEISVIDANDEVIGWNKHDARIFRRPLTSMGLNFRQCHPEQSLPKVEQIVAEMKEGKRDRFRFWINLPLPLGSDNPPHRILIEFFALRDDSGKYLGCLEFTQDIEEIRQLEGEKRLMD